MQENIFNPLALELRMLFEACHDSGFTEQQAFELTKTYCSIAFVNQAVQTSQYEHRYRSKRELTEQFAKYVDKRKKEETHE